MIRALIFDFDGLILDTEVPVYESWRWLYRRFGHDLPLDLWINTIGSDYEKSGFHPLNHLAGLVGDPFDHDSLESERFAHELEIIEDEAILPGVEAHIAGAKARGMKLGIASSSPRSWVEGHLERLGLLDHFDAIRTSDDVASVKPAPDLFLAALDALNVGADEAIVYEDSANGITAARAAGIFAVAVPNDLTAQFDLSHASMVVRSLAETSLDDILNAANGSRKN